MEPHHIEHVRRGVCALGVMKVSEEEFRSDPNREVLDIVGSAFVIRTGLAMTCAHVLDEIVATVKRLRARFPDATAGAHFVIPAEGTQWRTLFRGIEPSEVYQGFDLATLRFNTDQPPVLTPVPIVGRGYVPTVGEGIALCGYAHGSLLLHEGKRVHRFGPVLQHGHVAAVAPFDGPEPSSILLDVATGPAASGSPVFRESTGEVIGVLTKGQVGKTAAIAVATLIFNDGAVTARRTEIRPTRDSL